MRTLYTSMIDGDWDAALAQALVAWRASRAPALADLIEAIAPRCEVPVPVGKSPMELHLWWVTHAVKPSPIMVSALLGLLTDRADYLDSAGETVHARWANRRGESQLAAHLSGNPRTASPTNFQERLALLLSWDPDPRTARALVDCLRGLRPPRGYGVAGLSEIMADHVGVLGDRRMLAVLDLVIAEPRGETEYVRTNQVTNARRVREALDRIPMSHDPAVPQLEECLAMVVSLPVVPPSPRIDIEALWREVCANPDDVGTRAVLGDGLIECGDPRGDLIVLQCNVRTPNRPLRGRNRETYDGRVKTLVRKKWRDWFGDVSLILVRRGSEFRCGMLEVARVGNPSSPSWAYEKARAHRELCAVHTVRPCWIASPELATFLGALSRFPLTLGVDAPDVFDHLETRAIAADRLTTLEIMKHPLDRPPLAPQARWTTRPLRESLERVAKLAPHLAQIHVFEPAIAFELQRLTGEPLSKLFPKLERIEVERDVADAARELVISPLVHVRSAI